MVDVAGLAERVLSMPVAESRYSALRAVAGGLAWLREPVIGVLGEGATVPDGSKPRPVLERYDLTRRKATDLVTGLDWFEVSGDGEWLAVRDGGELRVVPAQRKADQDGGDTVQVDLSRARFLADPAALWRHAYGEVGRYMRHDFWVPDMSGVDWDGVAEEYRPALSRVSSPAEFADLLWEVVGELGTSHAYIRASRPPGEDGDGEPGLLGADLARDPDGSWRIARVLPGESSDPRARSPLAAPGTAVQPGDILLAVDGRPVDPQAGPGPLLIGAAGKPVELAVATADGPVRRFAVTPLASERRLRYQDWVAGNRRLVRELSGGRAGYLHIPDMMGEGWAHFHRDLRVEMARDTLIMDIRMNRGGHVSELVVEKLARRIMGWDMPRSMQPVSYPKDTPRGPVVALADENAGSDGDMITAAIKILGLGTVVGARTWGGVIGIGDPFRLVDGTSMTVPRYAIWLNGFGWGVENHGVDPDTEVLISPDDWAAGRDPQLETATRLAMEQLEARPAAQPPDYSGRPSRARPPLPPRVGLTRAGLERRLVAADPVHLEPGERGRPGAGHLEHADQHQQPAADPGDQLGVPPGPAERGHPALERERHDQERDAQAQPVDERQHRAAHRGARGEGHGQHHAQGGTDAGRPAQREQHAEQRRAGQPGPRPERGPGDPPGDREPVEHPGEQQAEHDGHRAQHLGQAGRVPLQHQARGCRRPALRWRTPARNRARTAACRAWCGRALAPPGRGRWPPPRRARPR